MTIPKTALFEEAEEDDEEMRDEALPEIDVRCLLSLRRIGILSVVFVCSSGCVFPGTRRRARYR